MDEVLEKVRVLATALRKDLHERFSGVPIGHGRVTDDEFVLLCLDNASDPNWAAAVFFAEGGETWIVRFERVTGKRWESLNEGRTDGAF